MKKLIEFYRVLCQYRKQHPLLYSARIAYGIAFRGLPF